MKNKTVQITTAIETTRLLQEPLKKARSYADYRAMVNQLALGGQNNGPRTKRCLYRVYPAQQPPYEPLGQNLKIHRCGCCSNQSH